ncbi:MAG: N-6 DNA methylase, partial [Chloroflexota bacterium]
VLVTNYRDFVLLAEGEGAAPVTLETYQLATDEAAFWTATSDPASFTARHGERFIEYLKRVMLHAAPLRTPQDVAWFLASYARDARLRMEGADLPALSNVRSTLEGALGVRFDAGRGEHFFRSTLVQTLFYGIFSAWVLWSAQHDPNDARASFDWQKAVWDLQVPMIRALFSKLANPDTLEPLNLVEVLNWTGLALNRVDRPAFFARFAEEHAVQYFYEPFLEAFDPELRRDLGVWYTPPEVIKYMVARVDSALKDELGIADGLADPRVYVLDPCCGTGGYLVEVLKHIAATVAARGEDALGGMEVKEAAMHRVFGFELLPAPFVVAHLQLGLFLQNTGVPFVPAKKERAAVYLTNALTGWDAGAKTPPLPIAAFQEERDAANQIKHKTPILVILGNPPYNGFAGIAIGEESALSNTYRRAKTTRQPQGQGLNDLYVRFFSLAEQRIVGATGQGIVCFISNYSWLDGLSFTAMRERYLEAFDSIWIDSLNGDKYKTGKLTPNGLPDPSIFSTEWNREGIQVGTAIALMVRKRAHQPAPTVQFRQVWGAKKRANLLTSLSRPHAELYEQVMPSATWGYPFAPMRAGDAYAAWPSLEALFPVSYPGVKTSRDDVVVDIDRDRLEARMRRYFDPAIGHEEMRRQIPP